jgi:hypothetical protein
MVCSLGYLSSYRYLFQNSLYENTYLLPFGSMPVILYAAGATHKSFRKPLVAIQTAHEATTADILVSSCFQKPIHIAPWGFRKHSCDTTSAFLTPL